MRAPHHNLIVQSYKNLLPQHTAWQPLKILIIRNIMKRNDRIRQKQDEALKRQSKYDKLSTNEKIKLAKSRRGESKKELKKLQEVVK